MLYNIALRPMWPDCESTENLTAKLKSVQVDGVIAADAEFNVIVPLTVITAAEAIAINFRLVMRIVDLSLLVIVQMRSQITAVTVQ